MILLDIDILALGKDVGSRLGNPNPLNASGGAGARTAPAGAPATAAPLKPIANTTPGEWAYSARNIHNLK